MMRTASCLCLLLLSACAHAGEFVRLEKGNLQTAVVTYTKGDVEVDLIGAVHVGDAAYYRDLNRRMKKYDALLYELVVPTKDAKPERKKSFNVMKMVLGLESQTEMIRYDRDNFVHADMTFDELKKALEKRGEDPLGFGLRVVADLWQTSKLMKKVGIQPAAPTSKKGMAKQLADAPPTTGSRNLDWLILTERNAKCMETFAAELKGGKKKFGIFYGAAHLPDLAKRLTDLGFKKTNKEWLTAWDMEDED
jgi:uncharacterized protein YbaP (TraB family)